MSIYQLRGTFNMNDRPDDRADLFAEICEKVIINLARKFLEGKSFHWGKFSSLPKDFVATSMKLTGKNYSLGKSSLTLEKNLSLLTDEVFLFSELNFPLFRCFALITNVTLKNWN